MPAESQTMGPVKICVLLLLPLAACAACGGSQAPGPSNAAAALGPPPGATEQPGSGMNAPAIDAKQLLEHIKVLASDEFEGRAPGSKGEELTVNYLIEQFKKIGLEPGNTDGTYVQNVPLVGITADPHVSLTFRNGSRQRSLKYPDEFVAWTKRVVEQAGLSNSELVFVGYGVVAPEFDWDDYKGLDVKGKTLVMLVNDPPVPDPTSPNELDPKVFGGKAMTYYGRWTYKFEIAAQKGAAGALVVHETGPAGYPYEVVKGNTGEKFDLVTPDKNMGRVAVEGWMTLEQARQLLVMSGQDFDALKKQAATREFRPVPLQTRASITLHNKLRTVDSRNVLAKLEGRDATLKAEYVVYSAHWDHLGRGEPVNGDDIYNGAVDNATGTAALIELARAFTTMLPSPKRSILFLALTAEEQGLLGSQYYAVTPIYPLEKTLANINIDVINVYGRTRDYTIVGLGSSDLDDYVRAAAAEQGREIRPDPEPEKGFYYRSDHFNFAKLGVPALDPDDGVEFVGKPADYGRQVRENWTANIYHKPQDEVKPDWDLSGAVEDLQLLWTVGYRVAQAENYPQWKAGTEFKARRDEMLKK
jgi:Zn-dependent M28 family amino/carboxypeptidase